MQQVDGFDRFICREAIPLTSTSTRSEWRMADGRWQGVGYQQVRRTGLVLIVNVSTVLVQVQ